MYTDLNDCISAAQTSLDAVYIDDPMNSTPYHLHAVLVHQGQASVGHYWAYVRKNHAFLKTQATSDGDDACSTGIQNESESIKQESQVTNKQTDIPIANTGQYTVEPSITESTHTSQEPSTPTVSSMENSPKSSSNEPQVSSEGDVGIPPATSIGVDKGMLNQGMDLEGGQNTTSSDNQSDDDVWLKFNDVAVSEVSWEDVQKESYGEGRNTSAYCLIYINKDLHEQFTKKSKYLKCCNKHNYQCLRETVATYYYICHSVCSVVQQELSFTYHLHIIIHVHLSGALLVIDSMRKWSVGI